MFVMRNAPALLPLVMIPLGLLARFGLADNRFYAGDAAFVIISGSYLAASALYLFYKWHHKGNSSPLIEVLFALAFHLLVLLFVLFVTGFLSAFLAVWIVLMVNADLRFGLKGYLASFLALCVSALVAIAVHTQLGNGEQSEVLQGALVVGAIAFVIARVRAIAERERSTLAKTRDEELYQRERLLALVNSMGDAMVATDEQGLIKVYNSTMLNLLDTNADIHDKPLDEILQLRDKDDKPLSIIAEAKQKRTIYSRTDVSRRLADGDSIKLYINVAPIQPGYQSHAERGFIVIIRDITKEKTLEEEKDEFVSVVSHELRTPVTIAEGNLSNIQLMFQHNAEKPVLEKAVADAHEQIVYLAKLVNDLSTLAKAERGTGGQAEVIDLNNILQEAHKEYLPQAEAKSLQFNLDVAPNLPKVNTNLLYLQEVLQNLITNAIKYTQKGSVTVKAHLVDGGAMAIEVSDTGIGISKSDQDHVFEKFYRAEDYRTRETSGTGLGLYVCKKLATKLGFNLTMSSRLNHGSTFSLQIPSAHVVTSAPTPAQPAETAAPVK